MKIRRFYGANLRAALRQVTEEFGNDAAILSNKKVPGGVEVIAALDYDESLVPEAAKNMSKGRSSLSHSQNLAEELIKTKPQTSVQTDSNQNDHLGAEAAAQSEAQFQSSPVHNSAPVQSPTAIQNNGAEQTEPSSQGFSEGLERVLKQAQQTQPTPGLRAHLDQSEQAKMVDSIAKQALQREHQTIPKPNNRQQQVEWSLDPSLQAMREELSLMRNMMSEQLKGIAWNRYSENNPVSAMITRRLANLGLDFDIVQKISPQVDLEQDPECQWQQTLATLAKSLPVVDNNLLENGGIYAFMGPTGVGKTTTIAKLAARYVIKHGANSVALITTDNYRISAQEQLATFGKILQLPVAKVNDADDLERQIKKFADKKLILIDTAGISNEDNQLSRPLESISECRLPIKKVLLMSAASQSRVLDKSLTLFSRFKPEFITITKLDEAAGMGEILSSVLKSQIPVIFTTDGQRIPEDIRAAKSHHLVSKAVWLANKFPRHTDEWDLAQSFERVKSA
ncbi:flagellar biosynthesis protein FlhF [Aliikangiella sp. IMCC44632]